MPSQNPALDFWIVYFKYSDLFGGSVTEKSLVELLKTFKRTEILILLSKIGLVLENTKAGWFTSKVQLFLITPFLDRECLQRLQNEARKFQKEHPEGKWIAVFSEFQIVNLIKLAIIHTREEGSAISTDEERFRFGRCCLMMNDLLTPPIPDVKRGNHEEVRQRLMEEVIRNYLFQDHEEFAYAFVRAHELFSEIPKELSHDPQYFDISGAFHQATGLSVQEYLGIGFSFWSWWSQVSLDTVATSPQIVINPKTFFQNVKCSKEKCEAIFEQLTLPVEKYRDSLQDERAVLSNDSQFRYSNLTLERYPLVESSGLLICLSMNFLSRKLTRNLFYAINDSLSYRDGERFRTFFGRVFEEYTRRLFQRCFQERCAIERYATEQAEAGEAILVYPRVLVIVEAKSSRLPLDVVRLGDLRAFHESIQRILIRACKQIHRVIEDFRSQKFIIRGVKSHDIGRFYPLIVTIQSFPQDPLTCADYDRLISENALFTASDIAPPTLISINELEHLEPLLQKMSMVEFLGAKTGDIRYRDMSVKNFIFSVYKGVSPNESMRDKFRNIGQSLMELLFLQK